MAPLGFEHVRDEPPEPSRSGLSRRQLLVRGVLATGAAFLGGFTLRYGPTFLSAPALGRRVLTAREEGIVRALLDTFFPRGADLPPADDGFILPRLDAYLAGTDADARLLFRAMLHVVEDSAVLSEGARFTRLDPAARARLVRYWELTPMYLRRMAFKSVKLLCAMPYFEQADVRREMGWFLGCAPDHLDLGEKKVVG